MKYEPIEVNLKKMLLELLLECLSVIMIPISIINLILYDGVGVTILNAVILMYFTVVASFSLFKDRWQS